MKGKPKVIAGQVMYMGPHIGFLGLHYNKVYRDGIDAQLYPWIMKCPALGELFFPVAEVARARKALNFDYAHNMKGGDGPIPTFYRAVQQWLAAQRQDQKKPPGITLEKHHA